MNPIEIEIEALEDGLKEIKDELYNNSKLIIVLDFALSHLNDKKSKYGLFIVKTINDLNIINQNLKLEQNYLEGSLYISHSQLENLKNEPNY